MFCRRSDRARMLLNTSSHKKHEPHLKNPLEMGTVSAASLGQVYKALTYENYWVAVKVQRPNLVFILRRDLVLIRAFGVFTAPFLPLNLGFGLGEIIDEFGRSLFEEIDYKQEADNAERFASLFSDRPAVYIPRVERMLSSEHVLTTSWIDGVKMRDRDELQKLRLDPSALIRTGDNVKIFLVQYHVLLLPLKNHQLYRLT